MSQGGTCASGEPGSAPGGGAALLGLTAEEPHWSRSERSSLEVALEHVSRPLSVVAGLDMDEPALSEGGRPGGGKPCSMKGTPPTWVGAQPWTSAAEEDKPAGLGGRLLPDRLLLLRVLAWAASIGPQGLRTRCRGGLGERFCFFHLDDSLIPPARIFNWHRRAEEEGEGSRYRPNYARTSSL